MTCTGPGRRWTAPADVRLFRAGGLTNGRRYDWIGSGRSGPGSSGRVGARVTPGAAPTPPGRPSPRPGPGLGRVTWRASDPSTAGVGVPPLRAGSDRHRRRQRPAGDGRPPAGARVQVALRARNPLGWSDTSRTGWVRTGESRRARVHHAGDRGGDHGIGHGIGHGVDHGVAGDIDQLHIEVSGGLQLAMKIVIALFLFGIALDVGSTTWLRRPPAAADRRRPARPVHRDAGADGAAHPGARRPWLGRDRHDPRGLLPGGEPRPTSSPTGRRATSLSDLAHDCLQRRRALVTPIAVAFWTGLNGSADQLMRDVSIDPWRWCWRSRC